MELVSIGFGSFIAPGKLVAAVEPESNPIKRVISQAKEAGRLIDATYGRKTEAVLIMESGHVLLVPVSPEELSGRMGQEGGAAHG